MPARDARRLHARSLGIPPVARYLADTEAGLSHPRYSG